MSEIVNCEYSKTIMDEPTCNAFNVNRYGEIICSEENCIILKLKEQLQAKEQECKELEEKLIKISANRNDTLSIVEDMAIFLGLDKKDHFNIYQCYYKLRELIENRNKEIYDLKKKKDECEKFYLTKYANKDSYCLELEHECEKLKSILQASDIAKSVISSAEINFPIIEKLNNALDEIKQTINNFPSKGIQDIPQTQIECTQHFLSVSETKLQKILDIIQKVKDVNNDN